MKYLIFGQNIDIIWYILIEIVIFFQNNILEIKVYKPGGVIKVSLGLAKIVPSSLTIPKIYISYYLFKSIIMSMIYLTL